MAVPDSMPIHDSLPMERKISNSPESLEPTTLWVVAASREYSRALNFPLITPGLSRPSQLKAYSIRRPTDDYADCLPDDLHTFLRQFTGTWPVQTEGNQSGDY